MITVKNGLSFEDNDLLNQIDHKLQSFLSTPQATIFAAGYISSVILTMLKIDLKIDKAELILLKYKSVVENTSLIKSYDFANFFHPKIKIADFLTKREIDSFSLFIGSNRNKSQLIENLTVYFYSYYKVANFGTTDVRTEPICQLLKITEILSSMPDPDRLVEIS